MEWRLNPKRYSSWLKLVRVYAWVYRFINNCNKSETLKSKGPLTQIEIKDSENIIIKQAQIEGFTDEYKPLMCGNSIPIKSKLLKLKPVIDQDGIMRSDGRLKYAEFLPYSVRYPIVLPRKHWVTKLIVKYYHEKGHHNAGTNHTLAELSSIYWIVCGREETREWENQCMECRRRKATAASQIMAPLPDIRVNLPLKAFSHVAVDYGGPFITIQGRGKRREKRYLCLFTCLASREVHIEVAFGLDTNSFLNAFYRMVYRGGLPTKVLSNNGTNVVGADGEIK